MSEEQIEFTLWCSDTSVFKPLGLDRNVDVCFIGTAFSVHSLSELINSISNDKENLQILIGLYLEYRRQYIFDLAKELCLRGFNYSRVEDRHLRTVTTNSQLQAIFADQLSSEMRINCLAALADTKLEIYGEPQSTWLELICSTNANLLPRFKFRAVREEEDLIRIYNQSKIGLNVQHDHARDCGLSIRVFDMMATKTLLITQSLSKTPLQSLGFVEGEDFISYTSPEDLRQKCVYYLKNDHEREAITESAFRKLKAGHTLRHRLAHVFSKAGLPKVAEHYLGLSDESVTDASCEAKIIFLDHFSKNDENQSRLENKLASSLAPNELAVELNSFRMRISLNAIPAPRWLKRAGKSFLRQTVRVLSRLGRASVTKLQD